MSYGNGGAKCGTIKQNFDDHRAEFYFDGHKTDGKERARLKRDKVRFVHILNLPISLRILWGMKSCRTSPIARQTASMVRAAAFRRKRLSLAKTCSMGFRSGEYLGRKKSLALAERMRRRTILLRWLPRLSAALC